MSQYDRQFGGWLPEDEFPYEPSGSWNAPPQRLPQENINDVVSAVKLRPAYAIGMYEARQTPYGSWYVAFIPSDSAAAHQFSFATPDGMAQYIAALLNAAGRITPLINRAA